MHYNRSSQLPENMPLPLQKIVRSSNKVCAYIHTYTNYCKILTKTSLIHSKFKQLQIWLWCNGANSVDKEHVGDIEYLPSPGFPVKYFPFIGQPNYLSPIVALRFKNITRKPLSMHASNKQ